MLTCSACGAQSPESSRFCHDCGAALSRSCTTCGAALAPGQRFCGECGTRADVSAPPPNTPQTERRVCSVLFADLVGFTTLSESRDPEEVRDLLSRYFETARTIIVRYGGVVEKFIGDAVMAVWGTPAATEGDAERAVRAGLDLVAAIGALGAELDAPGLSARAGVVTGEVAATIGAVGEGMVAGDAVNTAARVQSAASPGTVWVDSATQRLAGAAIGFSSAGEHVLKGKAEPVVLWQATRVHSVVGGAQRVDGLEAPMFGRDAEYRTLRELLHATIDRGTPRLVTVSGAAGIGKSRLGWEFEKYVDGLASTVLWHRGRCLSYGDGVAYWALAEAIRQRFGIAAEDPVAEATTKLVTRLPEWVPQPEQRLFVGVRLGRLLGLPYPGDTGAELGRQELFAGWRAFLERLATIDPVVLLIEDAHHADDALLDFVHHVVDWARQSPIYLVLMARPELLDKRPELGGGRNRTSLFLEPLDEKSMRNVVDGLVAGLPSDALTTLIGQAEGNPLFAVETIRALVDRDAIVPIDGQYRLVGDLGELAVPDSLHGLLAARLDALDPQQRALVADAAVLGTSFPAEALAAVSGRALSEVTADLQDLVHRGVLEISTDPLSPDRGFYLFGQNLLRQVAYDTLSRRDRRARHLAVAEHLQRSFTAGGDEVMDVIAQHYLDALDAISEPDDDAVRARALDAIVRAAERSRRAAAHRRAAASFEQAARLVLDTDPHAAAAHLEQSVLCFGPALEFDAAVVAGDRARELYLSLGDHRGAARVRGLVGRWLARARRLADSKVAIEEALSVLRENPDGDTLDALAALATTMAFQGDPGGRLVADEALGLAQELGVDTARLADLFGAAGIADIMARRVAQGIAALSYSVTLAARSGSITIHARSLNNLAGVQLLTDRPGALETSRTAVEQCLLTGDHYLLGAVFVTHCEVLLWVGQWDEGLAELDAAAETFEAVDDDVQVVRAVLLAMRGEVARATELATLPVQRASDDAQDYLYVAWCDAVVAERGGDLATARDVLASLFDLDNPPDPTSAPTYWSWPLAVRCAFALDDVAEARRLVQWLDALPPGQLPELLRATAIAARAHLAAVDGADPAAVDELFDKAVDRLRAAQSPYHLAHGLLDRADHRERTGRDAAADRDEASLIGAALRAVDISERLALVDRV